MSQIQISILKGLFHSDNYLRKAIPYLSEKYFEDEKFKKIFNEIVNFVDKYSSSPSYDAILNSVDQSEDITDEQASDIEGLLKNWKTDSMNSFNEQWLIDETEKFCKDRALYLAINDAIQIYDGDNGRKEKRNVGAIPDILTDALSISFDPNIGHDFLDNCEERWKFYHTKEDRLPFDLDILNKITQGGIPRKTLNLLLAGTGVGKSLILCHLATAYLQLNYKVLYLTMEMAEEKIAERIDANLLNTNLDDITNLPKNTYIGKLANFRVKTEGKLVIKEYATGSAHSGHFRYLLKELQLKKDFIPDVIIVDYINICASSRVKRGNANSYEYVKMIAEELRGLAVETKTVLWSATQTNRGGFGSSDIDLNETADSFGLPYTADFMLGVMQTDELKNLNQYLIKQLKSRYDDINKMRKFVIGVDKPKMRIYDLGPNAQDSIQKDIKKDSPKKDDPEIAEAWKERELEIKRETMTFKEKKKSTFSKIKV